MTKDSKGVIFDLPNEFSAIVKVCVSASVCVWGGVRGIRMSKDSELFLTFQMSLVPLSRHVRLRVCVCREGGGGGGEGGELSIKFSTIVKAWTVCVCVRVCVGGGETLN